jgi:DNA-binding NtrC family response regulator
VLFWHHLEVEPVAAPRDVLILDDDAMITRALARLLQGRHTVRLARTPEEALALMEERPPDVLLSDFELEQGTTAELLRTVKARWPAVRCVLHSASRMELWIALIKDKIVDSVLVKPASVDEILASMNGA